MPKPQRGRDTDPKPLKTKEVAVAAADDFGWEKIIKAAELVRLRPLTNKDVGLAASKTFNLMLNVAAQARFEDRLYTIPKRDIRRSHKSNEHIEDILIELQSTLYETEVKSPRGRPARLKTPLVSTTVDEIDDADDSLLYFRFTPELLKLYGSSTQYAELHGPTLIKFDSVYALRLYEIGRQMVGRKHPRMRLTVPELRELLRVPAGVYRDWTDLYRKTIGKAVAEVNQLADFVVVMPPNEVKRSGRKVVSIELQFWEKPGLDAAQAASERQRHSAGRRARRTNSVEDIAE